MVLLENSLTTGSDSGRSCAAGGPGKGKIRCRKGAHHGMSDFPRPCSPGHNLAVGRPGTLAIYRYGSGKGPSCPVSSEGEGNREVYCSADIGDVLASLAPWLAACLCRLARQECRFGSSNGHQQTPLARAIQGIDALSLCLKQARGRNSGIAPLEPPPSIRPRNGRTALAAGRGGYTFCAGKDGTKGAWCRLHKNGGCDPTVPIATHEPTHQAVYDERFGQS